ncbi:NADH:flavin oxidoreductase/NADH oxidase family protein [Shewanella surugensis]|uniref:NADH:flavin oxidoreductase/NADH oxidase family protein n=1 Tax=Shewanella surugensis TaxID=212020 RepID=A0ABT0LBQ7_9GAMM|nr:NADH:flavin oxidoreductase/NADH oxidase family protein [Shewanella surugensis]MCL1125123.1 NADH:flavin oxidoreductase/NADH oxidase family protein [Shewanella surugensis]
MQNTQTKQVNSPEPINSPERVESLDRTDRHERINKPTLSSAFTLSSGQLIKNRLFKSAMSEQLGTANHNPTSGLSTLYQRWAQGGIGLAMTGNIMIDRAALGEPKNVVLDKKSDLSAFKAWAKAGQANHTQLWTQLNHPGKQIPKFICDTPVAPSSIPLENGLEKGFNTPRALSENEINRIIQQFATSAMLSKQAGFSGVQIHGAHGYLVSQFLSSRHNQRTDQWGGSIENRMKFVLAVYHAIREQVGPTFPIGIKLNSADFMKGGFTEDESMTVVKALSQAGIDLIEISGGTYESPSMMGHKAKASTLKREAYFIDYIEKVRQLIDTPLVLTGGFRSAAGMQAALDTGATDFVGIARTIAVDPDFPQKLLANIKHQQELKKLTTGVRAIDKMTMLDITWYEQQLARMAKGKQPNPQLSEWATFFKVFMGAGIYAFKKRRV